MNSKHTKRALLSSFWALLLCFAMLLGTTFAWFTDTASTSVNKIQAGNLKIELGNYDKDNNWVDYEGKTLSWQKAEGAENEDVLWEPGCTYYLEPVVIRNMGNLALKYKVNVTGITGSAKLNEAIEWYVGLATDAFEPYAAVPTDELNQETLLDVGEEDELVIIGHMKEEAGNEYQGLSIDNVAITVYATQAPVESDSIDNTYDEDATLPTIVTAEEIEEQLKNGDNVTLALGAGTYTLPAVSNKTVTITGSEDTVIDMTTSAMNANGVSTAGLDITFDGVTVKFANENYKGIQHATKVVYKNCVIEGKQFMYANEVEFIDCTFVNDSDYCVWTYGAGTATFEGCTFNTAGKAILVYAEQWVDSQTVNVNNCTFNASETATTSAGDNCAAIEIDGSLITGTYTVNIDGTNNLSNKFNGISRVKNQKNPSNVTVNDDGELVEADVFVSTAADLAALADRAVNEGWGSSTKVTIALTNDIDMTGTSYTTPKHTGKSNLQVDTLTVLGNGHTIKGLDNPLFNMYGSVVNISNLTIKDSTMTKMTNNLGYGAFLEGAEWCNVTMTNCHADNVKLTAGDTRAAVLVGYLVGKAEITNCTVKNSSVTAQGSVAGIIGHAVDNSTNGWVGQTIKNCTVSGSSFNSTDDGGWRVGAVIGTIDGTSNTVVTGCTYSGNTLTQTGKTAPEQVAYGRNVNNGNLTIS